MMKVTFHSNLLDFISQVSCSIRSQMTVTKTVKNRNCHSFLPFDIIWRYPVNVLYNDVTSEGPLPSSAFSQRNSSYRTDIHLQPLFAMKRRLSIPTETTDDTSAILQWSTDKRAMKYCVSCFLHVDGNDHTRKNADDKSDSRSPSPQDKTPSLRNFPSALPPP